MAVYRTLYKRVLHKILIVSTLVLVSILDFSCIERYYLEAQIKQQTKIVVDALITNNSEKQYIKLSKTSTPEFYSIVPLTDCVVLIKDTVGNEFIFTENISEPGLYEGIIENQYLQIGNMLMLNFITNKGEEYVSNLEVFLACPPVDTIYYEIKRLSTSDPKVYEDGIQFYIDLNGKESDSRYFRLQLDETWEYHSVWPIRDYLDENNIFHDGLADYSYFVCYKTLAVDKVYTLTTNGLTQNHYKSYPLHFVNDHTQRLLYGYSLLVKQYAISKSAYSFWENLKKNNQESGGFFDSQPALVKGNIYNINKPDEEVLGFFGLSTIQTKRINVDKIKQFSFSELTSCDIMHVPPPGTRPLYFIKDGWGESECFDCRVKGGVTEKPDFWSN